MSINIMKTIDRAADTLDVDDGFVSEALGRRGAVLFFVLWWGLIPLGSMVNALWVGLILLAKYGPNDFGWSVGEFYSLCAGLGIVGILGVWLDIKEIATGEANAPRREP